MLYKFLLLYIIIKYKDLILTYVKNNKLYTIGFLLLAVDWFYIENGLFSFFEIFRKKPYKFVEIINISNDNSGALYESYECIILLVYVILYFIGY